MKPLFAFRWATLVIVMCSWMSPVWGDGLLGGTAWDPSGVAIGPNSNATNASVAIGSGARSASDSSMAIGRNASAGNVYDVAIGTNANSNTGGRNTAIGYGATISVRTTNSVAIGTSSTTSRNDDVSIGAAGHTRTLSNVTDGTDAHDAVNKGQLDSAIAGISSGVSAEEAQKMADTAQHNAVTEAKTHTDTEINKVLNSGSSTATGGFAIGEKAQASGEYSTSTGSGAVATGDASTATGVKSAAFGVNSTAIGGSARATKDASVATGAGSAATGKSSIATGWVSQAAGDYSIATGDSAKAEGKNSVALGANSQAKNANEVNIGIWSDDTQTDTRTLSGLKDGVNPDEAVNKGQLDTAKASAIREANKHTDDEIGKLATEAQGYATAAQTAANKYTDDTVSKVNEKVLKDANTYTDDTAKKTLKTANEHTERRAVIAENNAVTRSNAYTDESSSRTLERANTYTNHRAAQAENNAVARSNAYTNKRFGELKNQVDRNEKRANGGIAGAMAMSTITGSGSGFGMALSGYRDQSAIAAGIQKSITPNTTVNVKVAWDSGNGVGAAAGFFTSW